MLCRLGKRKASERRDEASQEARHSKRAAVAGSVPKDTGHAADLPLSGNSLQDATIQGQQADTRGQKRAAEAQSTDAYRGVATAQASQQPEAKRSAPSFEEQSGECVVTFTTAYRTLWDGMQLRQQLCSSAISPLSNSLIRWSAGAASKPIVSKRYRVVREPFTAPLTPVEQADLNAQQNKKRRRHRVQFAGAHA